MTNSVVVWVRLSISVDNSTAVAVLQIVLFEVMSSVSVRVIFRRAVEVVVITLVISEVTVSTSVWVKFRKEVTVAVKSRVTVSVFGTMLVSISVTL